MFYERQGQDRLRFGDVLKGYPSTTPRIAEPILTRSASAYAIDVDIPEFSVVMDPCCQIGKKVVSLTPLIEVWGTFFDNPYLEEDLTRVNQKIDPQNTVPPDVWEGFPQDLKTKKLAEGKKYAFMNLFVYEKHDLLPTYSVHRKTGVLRTNYYMIDFRNIFKLQCEKLTTAENAPLQSKILQLTIQARSDLRDKISFYFGNPPVEDTL